MWGHKMPPCSTFYFSLHIRSALTPKEGIRPVNIAVSRFSVFQLYALIYLLGTVEKVPLHFGPGEQTAVHLRATLELPPASSHPWNEKIYNAFNSVHCRSRLCLPMAAQGLVQHCINLIPTLLQYPKVQSLLSTWCCAPSLPLSHTCVSICTVVFTGYAVSVVSLCTSLFTLFSLQWLPPIWPIAPLIETYTSESKVHVIHRIKNIQREQEQMHKLPQTRAQNLSIHFPSGW